MRICSDGKNPYHLLSINEVNGLITRSVQYGIQVKNSEAKSFPGTIRLTSFAGKLPNHTFSRADHFPGNFCTIPIDFRQETHYDVDIREMSLYKNGVGEDVYFNPRFTIMSILKRRSSLIYGESNPV
ncbi:hypothetical protein FJZ18_03670 [Candidatus Pacearchaeota archaeon]|nr:hypothetical protein [Candidatus Pacearchaeota archaeon]